MPSGSIPVPRPSDAVAEASDAGRARAVVLVVDDSRFVRATIVRALGGDFMLQQAESGERAWELLLLDPSIRAVLSDLTMPGMDGFELLRRVRESVLPRIRSLPFAVLSGADDPAQRTRAMTLGADRFVVKGDGFDGLHDWLHSRLDGAAPEAAGTANPMAPDALQHPATDEPAIAGSAIAEPADAEPAGGPRVAESAPFAIAAAQPQELPSPRISRVVPDPLQHWFEQQLVGLAAESAPPVLIRLHAPGFDDLPARLRRGVRAADALHQQGPDTAWLFVTAAAPIALKLALRFGLLAAGRASGESGSPARVCVSMQPLDRHDPRAALARLQQAPTMLPPPGRVAVDCAAGAWGEGWRFDMPWAAARLLIG